MAVNRGMAKLFTRPVHPAIIPLYSAFNFPVPVAFGVGYSRSHHSRYFDFVSKHLQNEQNYTMSAELRKELQDAITNFEVMPSMRALMTAGKALDRDNTAGYNCSYLPVDDPKCFDEAMFILLNGTGVGFSVERQYIIKLPEVPEHI